MIGRHNGWDQMWSQKLSCPEERVGEAKRQRRIKEGSQDLLELPPPLVLGMIRRLGPRSPQVEIRAEEQPRPVQWTFCLVPWTFLTCGTIKSRRSGFQLFLSILSCWIASTQRTGTSWPTSAASLQFLSSQRLEHNETMDAKQSSDVGHRSKTGNTETRSWQGTETKD